MISSKLNARAVLDWAQTLDREQLTGPSLVKAAAALAVAYAISCIIYNLYFHPLRKFPGPFWARSTLLWRFVRSMDGRFHFHIENCHKKYGDVFRVSPNELSFCNPGAWASIYAPSHKGVAKILKNEFYDTFGAGFEQQSLGTERDPVLAQQKRALFSSALSARGLQQQEPVLRAAVGLFVEKLGRLGSGPQGLDMCPWFIYVGFDITGAMAFGESFGCVEREASHPWLDLMLGLMRSVTIMDNLRRWPLLVRAANCVPSNWTKGFRDQLIDFSRKKTAARLLKRGPQNDFLDNVAAKVHAGEVSQAEMEAHSWNMAMAGGETTGSSMASTLYFLLTTPRALRRLTDEVRAAYASPDDITVASTTTRLPYLMACLKEGLRIFPTAPQGTPRISPSPAGVEVAGHHVPPGAELYVSPWAATHDPRSWDEPYAFRPERWLDDGDDIVDEEEEQKRRETNKTATTTPTITNKDRREASQPFSLGPRVCPGKLFAFGQMSLQLACMAYAYDMELVNKDLDWFRDTRMHFLWWKPELRVRFTPAPARA